MIDPLFWLGLSILLVAVSLTAVLVAAIPALQELARAARSAEKLFDTLRRDLPPTLEAIRLTGLEISELTDDASDGVKSAVQVAQQVDQTLDSAVKKAQKVEIGTRSVLTGVKAAWKTLTRTPSNRRVRQLRDRAASPEALTSLEERSTSPYYSYKTNFKDSQTPLEEPANWHDSENRQLDFEAPPDE